MLSKRKEIVEGSSSAFMVIISSLPAHFIILERLAISRPRVIGLSALNRLKPSSLRFSETSATCDESMAWRDIPVPLISMLTLATRSLIESTIFLKICPCSSLASNI